MSSILDILPAHFDVAVVGAGPAGLRAAVDLDRRGLAVVLVDRATGPGGQVYAQSVSESVAHHTSPEALRLFAQLENSNIRCLWDTLVFDIPYPKTLAVLNEDQPSYLTADSVVFAPGAFERVIPFDGWTTPGVMTAGALLRLITIHGVLPGKRVLLTGTGPLLPLLAHEIVNLGGEVVEITENAPSGNRVGLAKLWRFPHLLSKSVPVLWSILRHRIPYRWQWAVSGVQQTAEALQVTTRKLNNHGLPIADRVRVHEVDLVAVHHGLIPSTQLPGIAECELTYSEELGGWIPKTDEWGRTSREGFYAVGDGAGIIGAEGAEVTGQLAALAVLHDRGELDSGRFSSLSASLLVSKQSYRRYWSTVAGVYPVPTQLYSCLDDDTIVCRCEDISLGEIKKAIADGASNVNQIKAWTRSGMGPCQGRMCGHTILQVLADTQNVDPNAAGYFKLRPPVEPVPIEVLEEAAIPSAAES